MATYREDDAGQGGVVLDVNIGQHLWQVVFTCSHIGQPGQQTTGRTVRQTQSSPHTSSTLHSTLSKYHISDTVKSTHFFNIAFYRTDCQADTVKSTHFFNTAFYTIKISHIWHSQVHTLFQHCILHYQNITYQTQSSPHTSSTLHSTLSKYHISDTVKSTHFFNTAFYTIKISHIWHSQVHTLLQHCILHYQNITYLTQSSPHTSSTLQGSSVIDYFLCSHDIMKEIGMMTVQPFTQFSDHRPLLLKIHLPIALPCKSKKPSLTTTSRPARHTNSLQHETQTHTRFYWDNDSANKLAHAFKTLAMRTLKNKLEVDIDATAHDLEECSREGVNKLADDLVHTLVQAAKMSTKHRESKKKRRRKPNKKWFDRDCHIERKEVKSLLNAINRQPYNRDLQVKYFARRKTYNRTVKQKKKAYKQKLISNLNDALDKDPQTVWKMLRELKDSENAEGESKYQTSATKWINHLENLISADVNVSHERKRQVATELTNAVNDTQSAHLDHPITSAEVVQACRTLKNRKAPGKDGITNEIIKASLPDMCNVLNKLFNVILSTGLNPDSWKTGVNVPIYKSGDPTNPSNYRGITLNSALGKLFYQILNNRVVEYLEDNDLLSKEQAGFRKGFRTTDHIFVLRKIIDKYIHNRNGRIYACFVDFQKAFDSVWHDALLLKLHNTGIQGKCFQTIRDMYRNSSVCAKTTDGYSRKIPVLKGVHQGNVLSPTLFNIFINDITNAMTGNHSPSINTNTVQIPCLLYADDIVILSQTKTGLQNKLDRLYDYCSAWGLQINRDKTKVIIFTRTDPKQKLFFKCGDDILETTDS